MIDPKSKLLRLPPDPVVCDFFEAQGYLEQAMALRSEPPAWTGTLECPFCGNKNAREMWFQEDIVKRRAIFGVVDGGVELLFEDCKGTTLLIANSWDDETFDADELGNERLYCLPCDKSFPIPAGLECNWISTELGSKVWPQGAREQADLTVTVVGVAQGQCGTSLRVIQQCGIRILQIFEKEKWQRMADSSWGRQTWEQGLSGRDRERLWPIARALEAMGAGPRW